jgi:hypothetical protein
MKILCNINDRVYAQMKVFAFEENFTVGKLTEFLLNNYDTFGIDFSDIERKKTPPAKKMSLDGGGDFDIKDKSVSNKKKKFLVHFTALVSGHLARGRIRMNFDFKPSSAKILASTEDLFLYLSELNPFVEIKTHAVTHYKNTRGEDEGIVWSNTALAGTPSDFSLKTPAEVLFDKTIKEVVALNAEQDYVFRRTTLAMKQMYRKEEPEFGDYNYDYNFNDDDDDSSE